MSGIFLSLEELEALREASLEFNRLYVLALRPQMDIQTGICGDRFSVTWQFMKSITTFNPSHGSSKPIYIPTRGHIRALIQEGIRLGLIVMKTISKNGRLVFRCLLPLADYRQKNSPAFSEPPPKTPPHKIFSPKNEQPYVNHRATTPQYEPNQAFTAEPPPQNIAENTHEQPIYKVKVKEKNKNKEEIAKNDDARAIGDPVVLNESNELTAVNQNFKSTFACASNIVQKFAPPTTTQPTSKQQSDYTAVTPSNFAQDGQTPRSALNHPTHPHRPTPKNNAVAHSPYGNSLGEVLMLRPAEQFLLVCEARKYTRSYQIEQAKNAECTKNANERQLEIIRLLKELRVLIGTSSPIVANWAKGNISDEQIIIAAQVAWRNREAAGDPKPPNVGYVNSILIGVLRKGTRHYEREITHPKKSEKRLILERQALEPAKKNDSEALRFVHDLMTQQHIDSGQPLTFGSNGHVLLPMQRTEEEERMAYEEKIRRDAKESGRSYEEQLAFDRELAEIIQNDMNEYQKVKKKLHNFLSDTALDLNPVALDDALLPDLEPQSDCDDCDDCDDYNDY